MTDTTPIKFNLNGIGDVTMKGTGPWSLLRHNSSSADIIDSTGVVTNPSVRSKARLAANVAFSMVKDAEAVVAKANEVFAAQA